MASGVSVKRKKQLVNRPALLLRADTDALAMTADASWACSRPPNGTILLTRDLLSAAPRGNRCRLAGPVGREYHSIPRPAEGRVLAAGAHGRRYGSCLRLLCARGRR